MAIITTYPLDIPETGDYLTGSKITTVGAQVNPTKNFTVSSVIEAGLGYTTYTALIDQTGAGVAPTEVLLKNNTGSTMTWTYNGVGAYSITSSSPIFLESKTMVCLMGQAQDGVFVTWEWFDTSTIEIYVYDSDGNPANDLTKLSFEIRIYS